MKKIVKSQVSRIGQRIFKKIKFDRKYKKILRDKVTNLNKRESLLQTFVFQVVCKNLYNFPYFLGDSYTFYGTDEVRITSTTTA